MKTYHVIKLDRRHKGTTLFQYYVEPVFHTHITDKVKFYEWRNWCWNTWGPSIERDAALDFGSNHYNVARWSWHTENGLKRIYFKSDKELNWFNLKWNI